MGQTNESTGAMAAQGGSSPQRRQTTLRRQPSPQRRFFILVTFRSMSTLRRPLVANMPFSREALLKLKHATPSKIEKTASLRAVTPSLGIESR